MTFYSRILYMGTANPITSTQIKRVAVAPSPYPTPTTPDTNQQIHPLSQFRMKQAEDSLQKTQELIEKAKEKGKTKNVKNRWEKPKKHLRKLTCTFVGAYVPANYWALQAMKLLVECRECIKNL